MGFAFQATKSPAAVPAAALGLWGIQHVSPRGRVKLKLAVAEPEPSEPANIMKPLGYAEFRASGTVGDDTESLWVWALDDPVTLWVEGADNVRLR